MSSSKKSEFTTIVAPQFICEAKSTDMLKKAVAKYRYPTESGRAIYIEISNSELGDIVLLFRTVWASSKYIGLEEDEILKDPQRPIPFIEGIVLREPITDNVVAAVNFEEAHEQLVKHYQDFWSLTVPMPAKPSVPFNFHRESDSNKNLVLQRESQSVVRIPQSKRWQCIGTFSDRSTDNSDVCSVAYSPSESKIAARYYDQSVKIWSLDKQEPEIIWNSYLGRNLSAIAFSPDGKMIATGGAESFGRKIIKLRHLDTGEDEIFPGNGEIYTVAFAFDPINGKFLVGGSLDNAIDLWVLYPKELRHTFRHLYAVMSLAISPDYKIMVSGDKQGLITLWDFEDGRKINTLQAHNGSVNSVVFSPNGKVFASGSHDDGGKIKLWNRVNGEQIRTIPVGSPVNSVAFSPDGGTIASGSNDKEIKIWDVETGQKISSLFEHTEKVTSIAFSPDGRYLASGSKDGTVKVWQQV